MKNYYHLTKKELSFISSVQMPVTSYDGTSLSKPVVVVSYKPTNQVIRVYSLKWFKRMVKQDQVFTEIYKYDIFSMY